MSFPLRNVQFNNEPVKAEECVYPYIVGGKNSYQTEDRYYTIIELKELYESSDRVRAVSWSRSNLSQPAWLRMVKRKFCSIYLRY
jgi:hypothetical protein